MQMTQSPEKQKKTNRRKSEIKSQNKSRLTWQAAGIKVVILTNFINVQQRQQVAGRQSRSMMIPSLSLSQPQPHPRPQPHPHPQ